MNDLALFASGFFLGIAAMAGFGMWRLAKIRAYLSAPVSAGEPKENA